MAGVAKLNRAPVAAREQIVPDIVRQHVEQAAFLWAQRDMLADHAALLRTLREGDARILETLTEIKEE